MDNEEKRKLESMKSNLRWECTRSSIATRDDWFEEKRKELDPPPPPKIWTKKEVTAEIRKIKRLEKKLSTKE